MKYIRRKALLPTVLKACTLGQLLGREQPDRPSTERPRVSTVPGFKATDSKTEQPGQGGPPSWAPLSDAVQVCPRQALHSSLPAGCRGAGERQGVSPRCFPAQCVLGTGLAEQQAHPQDGPSDRLLCSHKSRHLHFPCLSSLSKDTMSNFEDVKRHFEQMCVYMCSCGKMR